MSFINEPYGGTQVAQTFWEVVMKFSIVWSASFVVLYSEDLMKTTINLSNCQLRLSLKGKIAWILL